MRFVDIAIDLAAVFSASRSVAWKHVALRARQLDAYGNSSSVAAALRRQRKTPANSGHEGSRDPTLGRKARPTAQVDAEATASPRNTRLEPSNSETAAPGISEQDSGFGWKGRTAETFVQTPLKSWQDTTQSASPGIREPRSQRDSAEQPAGPATKSEFKPAYWAEMNAATLKHVKPSKPLSVASPNQGGVVQDQGEVPKGINFNIFHTSRGSRLVDKLKQPEEERPRDPEKLSETQAEVDSLPAQSEVATAENETVPIGDQTSKQPGVKGEAIDTFEESVSHTTVAAEKQIFREDVSALGQLAAETTAPAYQLRESKVPSSRISRLWNYGGLAAGMLGGALTESLSRVAGGGGQGSVMLSGANMERLVSKLSRMRGAALKLGQMMSFQDSKMLPGPLQEVLQRVQDRADYMPAWQRDRVLSANLGSDWRELYDTFEEKPIAAASIGQVHRATLRSNGAQVAVKIQFPGVADSINSDLDNLAVLLAATKLLPKGLYLNKTIENARTELGWECDYEREAQCAQRYQDLLAEEQDVFVVPTIHPEACGKQVLTMEYMEGVGVTRVKSFTQEQRDWIGTQILRLCLREITEFKFMQTDPNWTNFLYNGDRNKLELLDFGASREYPDRFVTLYVQLLAAASRKDRDAVKAFSEELGYLTGHESKTMLDAHIQSVVTLAEPFLQSAPEVYDFKDQTITERVKELIPVMIRERLAPPPEETYSLHRKLSGAFLLCARLGSKVPCRELFMNSIEKSGILSKAV